MKRWLRWSFLASLAVALDASGAVHYAAGDFSFDYPSDLLVLQDYVYTEASAPGSAHVVVLRHRDAEAGDLRSIEINMLRSLRRRQTCGEYTSCRVVDGIVIGTNSEDEGLKRAFEAVTNTFKRR